MATTASRLTIPDPQLLPPRDEPYLLKNVQILVRDGCVVEVVLDWGDSYLAVQVDPDTDTLNAHFHQRAFKPTKSHHQAGTSSTWQPCLEKECGWTWVAINQQGYCDSVLLSFDGLVPSVLLHALASSIKCMAVSS